MKKLFRIYMILVVLSIFLVALTSCNFPTTGLHSSITTPPPIPAATTQPPPKSASTAFAENPSPEVSATATPAESDIAPVAGSILRWIDYSDFVFIPAGNYTIGDDNNTPSDHAPAHQVSLNGFWIQQAEVTNQQYAQCVIDKKCSAPNREQDVPYWFNDPSKGSYPVVGVSWFQAEEYCTYINGRLPSEAEWEAASRGLEAKPYPWGTEEPKCDLLDYNDCLDPSESDEIRSYKNGASDFNAMDMSGNVSEWVNDWYQDDYYTTSPSVDPRGPEEGIKRVYRGGGYDSALNDVNAYVRFAIKPDQHAANLGFRCALLGDPNSEKQNIGKPCSVPGNGDGLKNQPTFTPYPCSPASVSAYCQIQSSKPVFAIKIEQSNCMNNMLTGLTGNSNPLNCTVSQLSGGGNQFLCTYPGLSQGAKVYVSFCHAFNAQIQAITCPTGYTLDQKSKLCELDTTSQSGPPCSKGYIDVPPNGCMPVSDPNNGCPVGYYQKTMPLTSVCIPYNECQLPKPPAVCQNPSCTAGQIYNTTKGCCESQQTHAFCAGNLLYNADQKVCIGSDMYPNECPVIQVTVPYCPTLTPSPSPTPTEHCYWKTNYATKPASRKWVCE